MNLFLFLLIGGAVLYWFCFRKGKKNRKDRTKLEERNIIPINPTTSKQVPQQEEVIHLPIVLADEAGKPYREVTKIRENPRHTYIWGRLKGKYWGEQNKELNEHYDHSSFYDFSIYELEVIDAIFAQIPFDPMHDKLFPREKLPEILPVQLEKDGVFYGVNVHHPQLGYVTSVRKLHQQHENMVFGTISGYITGYILDFIEEGYVEQQYLEPEVVTESITKEATNLSTPESYLETAYPTGKVEYDGIYKRLEYYQHYQTKHQYRAWGKWVLNSTYSPASSGGCLTDVLGALGLFLGFFVVLALLPRLAIFIPFLFLLVLLVLFGKYIKWITGFFGLLLVLLFVRAIVGQGRQRAVVIPEQHAVNHTRRDRQRIPVDRATKDKKVINKANISKRRKVHVQSDTLITHYHRWKDYEGTSYNGHYTMRISDYNRAKAFKNNLPSMNTLADYDTNVQRLARNESNQLTSLYTMFDTLAMEKHLDRIHFSDMVVSFVQHIPYTLVLPYDCDPNLYHSDFVRKYLVSANFRCEGHARFGINSPIEFLTHLKGDCDSRTLLLYTILTHYQYDVVMLSSEFYGHALLGVNLPYGGFKFPGTYSTYTLWETTSHYPAGVIAPQLQQLNHWRICLKNKQYELQ